MVGGAGRRLSQQSSSSFPSGTPVLARVRPARTAALSTYSVATATSAVSPSSGKERLGAGTEATGSKAGGRPLSSWVELVPGLELVLELELVPQPLETRLTTVSQRITQMLV